MCRLPKAKLVGASIAVLLCGAISYAQATTLDKLFGKSLTVGNFVFANFAAPSFTGAGPSNIDVQGVVLTDPDTGKQQTGLRFVIVPGPFSLSPSGGPHEVGFLIDYSVTDAAGQLTAIATSINSTVAGQAGVHFDTTASPSASVAFGSLAEPTLTILGYCNWFGSMCVQSSSASSTSFAIVYTGNPSVVAPLFPAGSTYYVQHKIDLQISNRKGVPGGTTTLQQFETLFSE
jgi:hypothetical protein